MTKVVTAMHPTSVSGLRNYVRLVAANLGVEEAAAMVTVEPPPAVAYLPLDGHLPHYPNQYPALTWDELHGWAMAVETEASETVPLVWLGGTVMPSSGAVAEFATALYADENPHVPRPPTLRTPGSPEDDLSTRLANHSALQAVPLNHGHVARQRRRNLRVRRRT